MKQHALTNNSKKMVKQLVATKAMQSRMHKRTFKQFASKLGFVYFGYVDQRNDEHNLVRGLTVSTKHHDNHYCIGSYSDYDVTLVERSDTIRFPGKPAKAHNWVIMVFDLHRSVDLPHIFLGLKTHSEAFYAQFFTKFSHFSAVNLGTEHPYDADFMRRYTMYTKPEQALSAERLINQPIAKRINERFGNLSIEISENCLFLYAENQRPTTVLLDTMLSRGIWLAQTLDRQAVEMQSS